MNANTSEFGNFPEKIEHAISPLEESESAEPSFVQQVLRLVRNTFAPPLWLLRAFAVRAVGLLHDLCSRLTDLRVVSALLQALRPYYTWFHDKLINLPIVVFYSYLWKVNKLHLVSSLFVSYAMPLILEMLPWFFSRRKVAQNLRDIRNTLQHNMVHSRGLHAKSIMMFVGHTFLYAVLQVFDIQVRARVAIVNKYIIKRLVMERLLYSEIGATQRQQKQITEDNLRFGRRRTAAAAPPTASLSHTLESDVSRDITRTLTLFNYTIPNIIGGVFACVRDSGELWAHRHAFDILALARPFVVQGLSIGARWLRELLIDQKRHVLMQTNSNQMSRLMTHACDGLQDIQLNNLQRHQLGNLDRLIDEEIGVSQGLSMVVMRLWDTVSHRNLFDFVSEVLVVHTVMRRRRITHEQYRKVQNDIDHVVNVAQRVVTLSMSAWDMIESQGRVARLLALPNFMRDDEDLISDIGELRQLQVIPPLKLVYDQRRAPALRIKEPMIFENGKTYAVIGKNGSGKSTLCHLLCRILHPTTGRLTWNSIPYEDISRNALRKMISYVPQRPYIFGGTIRSNITVGNPDASEAEVIEAADAAGLFAYEFNDANTSAALAASGLHPHSHPHPHSHHAHVHHSSRSSHATSSRATASCSTASSSSSTASSSTATTSAAAPLTSAVQPALITSSVCGELAFPSDTDFYPFAEVLSGDLNHTAPADSPFLPIYDGVSPFLQLQQQQQQQHFANASESGLGLGLPIRHSLSLGDLQSPVGDLDSDAAPSPVPSAATSSSLASTSASAPTPSLSLASRRHVSTGKLSQLSTSRSAGPHQHQRSLRGRRRTDILDMDTGLRGEKLSGGLLQSVVLARIFLRKTAQVIILDEAIGQMDAFKKREVIVPRLYNFIRSHNMTLIMVTHDLVSVRDADHIYVMDSGRLVHSGTHAELVQRGAATYLKLLGLPADAQAQARVEAEAAAERAAQADADKRFAELRKSRPRLSTDDANSGVETPTKPKPKPGSPKTSSASTPHTDAPPRDSGGAADALQPADGAGADGAASQSSSEADSETATTTSSESSDEEDDDEDGSPSDED